MIYMYARTTSALPHSARTHSGYGLLLQRKCACGAGGEYQAAAQRSIDASNNPLEREADRVADQVLAAPA